MRSYQAAAVVILFAVLLAFSQTSRPRPGASPSVVSSFLRWGGGAFYSGNCLKLDSTGAAVDAGGPCSLPAGDVLFFSGPRTSGHCLEFDAQGRAVSAGAPCGTGSGGGSPPTWNIVDFEVPAGNVDGVTNSFTLANAPNPANSLKVFRNGLRLRAGGVDYTLNGTVINFLPAAIPQIGDQFFVEYRY
jgi:hypothetical protein